MSWEAGAGFRVSVGAGSVSGQGGGCVVGCPSSVSPAVTASLGAPRPSTSPGAGKRVLSGNQQDLKVGK